MSIAYEGFRLATVPRTGTTWFLEACKEAGLGQGFKAHAHAPFSKDENGALKVTLIRHPFYWLQSYFKSIYPGSVLIPEVDKLRLVDDGIPLANNNESDFDKFVQMYLNACPGQVGRIFASYGADTYLRIEDMPWAAIELFHSLGLPPHRRNRCRYIDPMNVSKTHFVRDPEMYRLVMSAEKEMADRYEYF